MTDTKEFDKLHEAWSAAMGKYVPLWWGVNVACGGVFVMMVHNTWGACVVPRPLGEGLAVAGAMVAWTLFWPIAVCIVWRKLNASEPGKKARPPSLLNQVATAAEQAGPGA